MSQLQYFNTGGTPGIPNIEFVAGNDVVPVGPNPATFTINIIGDLTQGVDVTNTAPFTETITVANATTSTVGVASFNPLQFTVTDGAVSLLGSAVGQTITGTTGGPLSPTAGNWNILASAVAAGTTPIEIPGSVSTLTINVQRSQAIASTNASNVGLSAFNSAQFTVDGNGFVSLDSGLFVQSITDGTNINLTGTATNPIINVNDPILLQNDSASAPGYSFVNSTNSGLFFEPGYPGPAISQNGVEVIIFGQNQVQVQRQLIIQWQLSMGGSVPKSADYVDNGEDFYIGYTSTAASYTYTLPPTPSNGTIIVVKDESGAAGTNAITINTSDSSTIDGQSTAIIFKNYGSLTMLYRAANWNII